MKKWLSLILLGITAGCGSTGTEASGDDDTGSFSCTGGSVSLGPGLLCDTTTLPPTIRIDFGAGAGQVAAGNDSRFGALDPNKGKILGTFVPSTTQSTPPTQASPGGQVAGKLGQIIFNLQSGRIGVRAANEICAAIVDWPGQTGAVASGHACTSTELLNNAHAGNLVVGQQGAAFDSAPYVEYAAGAVPADTHSWKASCGNWSYNSADLYQGARWLYAVNDPKDVVSAGEEADKAGAIQFQSKQPCNTALPIACCR